MLPFGLGNGRSGRRAQCVDGSFRGLNRFNCRSWRQRRSYHASRPSRLLPKAQCLQVLNVSPHGYPRVLTFLVADVICFVSKIIGKSFEQELHVNHIKPATKLEAHLPQTARGLKLEGGVKCHTGVLFRVNSGDDRTMPLAARANNQLLQ